MIVGCDLPFPSEMGKKNFIFSQRTYQKQDGNTELILSQSAAPGIPLFPIPFSGSSTENLAVFKGFQKTLLKNCIL